MTRYARASGSKACNSRQACPATPWKSFKEQIVSGKSDTEPVNKTVNSCQEDKVTITDSEGSWYEFQVDSKSSEKNSFVVSAKPSSQNKRERNETPKASSTEETKLESKMKKIDVQHELRNIKTEFDKGNKKVSQKKKNLQKYFSSSGTFRVIDSVPCNGKPIQEKVSSTKNLEKVSSTKNLEKVSFNKNLEVKTTKNLEKVYSTKTYLNDLRDSRRNAKALKREKQKLCFCCRRWGHQLADCPEAQKDNKMDVIVTPGSFCYNCGSTEHTMSHCSKPGRKSFKYAHCFVCGEEGHLARQCPDNPKGSYPKGGSCHLCGEVTHMRANCPKAKEESQDLETTLTRVTSGPIESLPEDFKKSSQPAKSKRIVKFT